MLWRSELWVFAGEAEIESSWSTVVEAGRFGMRGMFILLLLMNGLKLSTSLEKSLKKLANSFSK
jgi:hypothetical protein